MKNSEFITGKVPITKEEVRAICLNKLELKDKRSFLDVGAGTGTIGIEAALTYPKLEVIGVEHVDKAIDIIQKNVDKFEISNYKLIKGHAPVLLEQKVDAIFIGGSDGKLEEIIKWSLELLNEGGTLAMNFLLVQNFYEALEILKDTSFKNIESSMISVCHLEKLGKGEYFKPFNPIYIVSCKKESV